MEKTIEELITENNELLQKLLDELKELRATNETALRELKKINFRMI